MIYTNQTFFSWANASRFEEDTIKREPYLIKYALVDALI